MNIMHLSRAEYQTLSTTGTLTKAGTTYTFDPINTEYVVPDHAYMHIMVITCGSDDFYFDGTIKIINKNPTPYLLNTWEHQNQKNFTNEDLEKAVLVGGQVKSYSDVVYKGAYNILSGGRVEFMDENGYHSGVVDWNSFANSNGTDKVVELF